MNVHVGELTGAGLVDLSWTPWRRLELSARRGIWCLVDAEDWDWISETGWNWGWHRSTPWKHYAKRNSGTARSTIYLHREVLVRADPRDAGFHKAHMGDHINGNSLDNRRANLRWATAAANGAHKIPRAEVATLDQIVAGLIGELAKPPAIPF